MTVIKVITMDKKVNNSELSICGMAEEALREVSKVTPLAIGRALFVASMDLWSDKHYYSVVNGAPESIGRAIARSLRGNTEGRRVMMEAILEWLRGLEDSELPRTEKEIARIFERVARENELETK